MFVVITRDSLLNLALKRVTYLCILTEYLLNQQPTLEELIEHPRTAEWYQLGVKVGLDSLDLAECHDCTSMYELWRKQEKQQGGVY